MIAATLAPWVARHTLAELGELFDRHGVSWGPYQTFTELVEDVPRCSIETPMFAELEQPGIGTYLMPGSLRSGSRTPSGSLRRAPLHGEHTDEVLAGVLGLSDAEIGAMHDRDTVAGADRAPV